MRRCGGPTRPTIEREAHLARQRPGHGKAPPPKAQAAAKRKTTLPVVIGLLALGGIGGAALVFFGLPGDARTCAEPTPLTFTIESKITRSAPGFTQGLEFRDRKLYESTGNVGGTSRVNVIGLDGKVTVLADQGTAVFGEGLTIFNNEIVQLTWQDKVVFVYDMAGKVIRKMPNPREGWGLTNDGRQLIFSDGTPSFFFTDPKTFAITRTVPVRSSWASALQGLNELEYVAGKIFGNIFTTRMVVRIVPTTGCVDAVADLGVLWSAMTPQERAQIGSDDNNVLNGIAHDAKTGLFYLTGKRWPVIFVGRFAERRR
jgi:glutamine cyclotransferase